MSCYDMMHFIAGCIQDRVSISDYEKFISDSNVNSDSA